MHLFLVLTRYMNGLQDERVFSSGRDAYAYIRSVTQIHASEILEIPVIGELESPDTVYTVSWNDRTRDTCNFEGVYGSYPHAKRAVGDQGRVLRRAIHVSDIDGQQPSSVMLQQRVARKAKFLGFHGAT